VCTHNTCHQWPHTLTLVTLITILSHTQRQLNALELAESGIGLIIAGNDTSGLGVTLTCYNLTPSHLCSQTSHFVTHAEAAACTGAGGEWHWADHCRQ
jgi:hypothetical protein